MLKVTLVAEPGFGSVVRGIMLADVHDPELPSTPRPAVSTVGLRTQPTSSVSAA